MADCAPWFTPSTHNNTLCVPECPLRLYSDAQYDAIFYASLALAGVSLCTSLGAAVPLLMLKSRRRWPQLMLPAMLLAVFVFSLRTFVPVLGYGFRWRRMLCSARTEQYHSARSSAACAFSGAVGYTAGMVACCLWLVHAGGVFVKVFGARVPLSPRAQAWTVFGSIAALTLGGLTVALASDAIDAWPEGGQCFISQGKANGHYLMALWSAPILLYLLLGWMLIGAVCVYMCVRSDAGARWDFVRSQWRLLAYLVLFSLPAGTIAVQSMVWVPRTRRVRLSVQYTLQCAAQTYYAMRAGGQSVDSATRWTRVQCARELYLPAYATTFWASTCTVGAAAAIGILFLLQRDVLVWWYATLRLHALTRHLPCALQGTVTLTVEAVTYDDLNGARNDSRMPRVVAVSAGAQSPRCVQLVPARRLEDERDTPSAQGCMSDTVQCRQ